MERKVAAGPEAGEIKEALGRLEEKKSKLADRLKDRKSKLGDCQNLFAANFKAARGVAAKGWESSSQSQEDAETGKQQQERMRKPGVEKNRTKKARRNLFGKQQSFQNARVQQEMQQKKRELGEHQRRREESKESLNGDSKEGLKGVKGATADPSIQLGYSKSKPEDETTEIVFPASPTKSVRQSQVASWVQQAHENEALRSRSPRDRKKSSAGKDQGGSKWVAYQRVKAGRRPSMVQEGTSGREGRRSRCSLRERQKQAEKPFDLFKDQNQCSFFDSKDKGEGPLDFLFADVNTKEEPTVKFALLSSGCFCNSCNCLL